MKKERDSGVELLRIISMLMVIGVHLWLYGGFFTASQQAGGIVASGALFLKIFFRSAVNIFIIISGFFTVKSSFDLKKSYSRVLKIFLSVFFYSVVLSVITLCLGADTRADLGITQPSFNICVQMFFPITTQIWYFITDYIFLMLFAPFLNIVLQKLTKNQYRILLLITGFIMSIWLFVGSIDITKPIFTLYGHTDLAAGKNVFSFMFMYIIGGYISLHCKLHEKPKAKYLVFTLICLYANYLIYTLFNGVIGCETVTFIYTNPFVILVAVFMFMFFKDLHFKSKIINTLGGTTLGVYAISEFYLVRAWIWSIINFSKVDCTNIFKNIVMVTFGILAVFFGCAIIDLLRQALFGAIGNAYKKLRKTE